ncbi:MULTISPECIES: cation diffusion facilitator family transporter [unclassified Corynebacterium]|uniref:cation diffusion facilitator family transporter n=1 Tax=unclassified Corynebacterium TaxID=2624378 RepID=UPI00286E4C7D|nr:MULTISPECIES: cation diffusion facilitator family transporter [unclassified Corynebacterium]
MSRKRRHLNHGHSRRPGETRSRGARRYSIRARDASESQTAPTPRTHDQEHSVPQQSKVLVGRGHARDDDHDHNHDHRNGHDHNHNHNHDHDHHSHAPEGLKALLTVLIFTATIFFAELIGGYISGSLALVSDAMHMLSDSTGLLVAALAIIFARKTASDTATYGYRRLEVVAALANALSVSIISLWIVVEAIMRFFAQEEINAPLMLGVGIIGLVANIFGALVLHGHSHSSMNMRGAYLHVLVDLFGSIAVIIAALAMIFYQIIWADTVASLIIAALILPRSMKLAWESLRVITEQVPLGVDMAEIKLALTHIDDVLTVHDLHVWSLDGNELIATCHLVVDRDMSIGSCTVLDKVQDRLLDFGIEHSTVQLEGPGHQRHETTC